MEKAATRRRINSLKYQTKLAEESLTVLRQNGKKGSLRGSNSSAGMQLVLETKTAGQ